MYLKLQKSFNLLFHPFYHKLLWTEQHGQWIYHQEGVSNIFLEYFKDLFKKQGTLPEHEMRMRINALPLPVLTNDHKALFGKPFTTEEVKVAAFQIGPFKALGIDGKLGIFLPKILKYCWRTHNYIHSCISQF